MSRNKMSERIPDAKSKPVCARERAFGCVRACVYTMYARVHMGLYVHVSVRLVVFVRACMHVRAHPHPHVPVCARECAFGCVPACVYACTRVCLCVQVDSAFVETRTREHSNARSHGSCVEECKTTFWCESVIKV